MSSMFAPEVAFTKSNVCVPINNMCPVCVLNNNITSNVCVPNNNNTQIAAIALPPSTTHPQLWAKLLTFKPKCTVARYAHIIYVYRPSCVQ